MIGIIRATWPNLILLYRLNKKNELVRTSVMDIAMYIRTEEKRAKSNEVILIALITIFILFFFARSLVIFLILLAFGLIIGVFGLIKNIR
ncbi:hypothetical protein D4R86_01850 [bacterium]|nr:MAG: hypothetical protein D4R86_01850 [bacterium]